MDDTNLLRDRCSAGLAFIWPLLVGSLAVFWLGVAFFGLHACFTFLKVLFWRVLQLIAGGGVGWGRGPLCSSPCVTISVGSKTCGGFNRSFPLRTFWWHIFLREGRYWPAKADRT